MSGVVREYISNSVAETERVAGEIVRGLPAGAVIALEGELGAGKTQFVRGVVRALGGEPRAVSSPTFTLLNIYRTARCSVFHLDAYRTGGEDDFEAIGFGELLEQGGITIVEWPSRVEGLLPKGTVRVRIEAIEEGVRRIVVIEGRSESGGGGHGQGS